MKGVTGVGWRVAHTPPGHLRLRARQAVSAPPSRGIQFRWQVVIGIEAAGFACELFLRRTSERRAKTFREPKQQPTREQLGRIVEVANQLFAKQGFERTKLTEIAKAVPCSMSSIYDRFPSKEDLLRYMRDAAIEESLGVLKMAENINPSSMRLPEILPLMIYAGIDRMRRYRGTQRAALERIDIDDDMRANEIAMREAFAEATSRFLLAFRDEIKHPEPELAVRQVERLLSSLLEQREGGVVPESSELDDATFVIEASRMVLGYLRFEVDSGSRD